jgi:hypothetical protein
MMRVLKVIGRLLSALVGSALILLGGLGVLFSIHALIDPASAQAADENNPFGPPPTFLHELGILGAYILLGVVGVFVVWIFARQRRRSV